MENIVNNTMISLMDNNTNPIDPSLADEVNEMLNYVLSTRDYNREAINFIIAIGNLNKICPNFSYNVLENKVSNFQKVSYNSNEQQITGGNILISDNVDYFTLIHESTHAIFNIASSCSTPDNYDEVIKNTKKVTKGNIKEINNLFDEYKKMKDEMSNHEEYTEATNELLNEWEKKYGFEEYKEIESACKTGVILNIRKKFNLAYNVTINDLLKRRNGNMGELINDMYRFLLNKKKTEIFCTLIGNDKNIQTIQCISDMLCAVFQADGLEYGNNRWDQVASHTSGYYENMMSTFSTIENGEVITTKVNIGKIRSIDEQLANFSVLKVLGQDGIVFKYFGEEYYNMMNNLYSKTINDAIDYEKKNEKMY